MFLSGNIMNTNNANIEKKPAADRPVSFPYPFLSAISPVYLTATHQTNKYAIIANIHNTIVQKVFIDLFQYLNSPKTDTPSDQ